LLGERREHGRCQQGSDQQGSRQLHVGGLVRWRKTR
jgi:hypothetical protein